MTQGESDETGWIRAPDPVQFMKPGAFEIWIVGSIARPSRGSAGISAAAWYVRRADDKELPYRFCRTSDQPDSDEQRGAAAAALRGLETLPAGSKAIIKTRVEHIADGINFRMEEWNQQADNARNGWEIWRAIEKRIIDEKLDVEAKFEKADDDVFKKLRGWALWEAKQKLASLKLPPGTMLEYGGKPDREESSDF